MKTAMIIAALVLTVLRPGSVWAESEPVVAACDRLAAAPDDPKAPGPGVELRSIDADAAIETCHRALAERPDEARLLYELGRAEMAAGRRNEAKRLWDDAASQGYPAAEYELGMLVLLAPPDPFNPIDGNVVEAANLFEPAAKAGHGSAATALGLAYETGRGVPADFERAASWYAQGTAIGNRLAMRALARMYRDGDGVRRDPDRAEALCRSAGTAPLPQSMAALAAAYGFVEETGLVYSETPGDDYAPGLLLRCPKSPP
jgi:hypothetical protein